MPDPETPAAAPAAAAPAPAKAAPETIVKAVTDEAKALDAAFEGWIASLRDGEIARHTPAWNRLMAEIPVIKASILKLL